MTSPLVRRRTAVHVVWLATAISAACSAQRSVVHDPAPAPAHQAGDSTANAMAPMAEDRLTFERIHRDPAMDGRTPASFAFAPRGGAFAFLKGSEQDADMLDLWGTSPAQGIPVLLVRASSLRGSRPPSEQERMADERKRVRHRGITSFSWCGDRAEHLLFPFEGDLYEVRSDAPGKPRKLALNGPPVLDARCSPRGRFLTFVRQGDLFTLERSTGEVRTITRGATATRTRGLAEFVAQEEMGRLEGYFWSRDERRLAYLEVDESAVGLKVRPRIYADHTEMFSQRYPAAGEANAKVSLFVYEHATQRTVAVPLPSEDGYVARVVWSPDGEALWVQWQSRDQRRLLLLEARAPAYRPELVLTESDEAWVSLHDDFRVLGGGERILWSSERTGTRQLYLASRSEGWRLVQLAPSAAQLAKLVGVDEEGGLAYALRVEDRSRQQQLFAVRLDGGGARQLSRGEGWHDVTMSDDAAWYIDAWSDWGRPPRVALHSKEGGERRVLAESTDAPIRRVRLPETQWLEVTAEDGTSLNGILMHPLGREAGQRYPVVVYTYAGPEGQLVNRKWNRLFPHFVALTHQGFGVFMLDGRGSGNRERSFTRAIYRRFGQVEVDDQVHGAQMLAQLPWVDASRIGIWGWSYGGYASLAALLREGSPFRAAVVVAAVTDWRLYDTHYTERYMGDPAEQGEAYARSALLDRAGGLQRPLLVMHGMADDNVLFEHSLRLVEALQQRSVPFELMVYPGRAHGLRGRATQLHVFRTISAFFHKHLGDAQGAPTARGETPHGN